MLGRQVVPATAAALALAFVLLVLPVSGRDWVEIGVAALLALGLLGVAVATQQRVAASLLPLALGYLLVTAVLRDAAGGGVSGFGGLFLLPVIVLALYGTRREVLAVLGAMAAANIVPILVVGSPAYPETTWRGALVQVGVAAVAGFTIQRLVSTTRAHNEQLRELGRTKDEFVSLVSHELRTPLTSIMGYLEMLPDDPEGHLSPMQATFLQTVERNVARLARLVENLLFVARLDEGRIQLRHEELDLAQLLQQAGASARPAAERRQIVLAVEVPDLPFVVGDRERLAQMVDNLVANAVKFTPEGGQVAIRASNGGSAVRVEVANTGVGIPEQELEHLFERFFRASTAREAETPGTGLGLAISQSIAHAHGTELAVTSRVGKGTTFRFELPVAAGPQRLHAE